MRGCLLVQAGAGPNNLPSTKSAVFVNEVIQGRLALKPNVRLVRENSVVFADGSIAEADTIVFSTGFMTAFPFVHLPKGIEV